MVKVTDKDYYLDGFAKEIGDKIAERVTTRNQDILILFDGAEGSGKTNASVALAYYLGYVTKRKFDVDNIFFDMDEMIKFAGSTKEQIILWDEAAIGGLAQDWNNPAQKKLNVMLMVCRKLRHIFIFNVPRFYKLSMGVIDRALCLFHIYENDKEEPGNFMFITKDYLYTLKQMSTNHKYVDYWSLKKLYGRFEWVLPKLINEEEYEAKKDKAILKVAGKETDNQESWREQWLESKIRETFKNLKILNYSDSKIAKIMKMERVTLRRLKRDWIKAGKLNNDSFGIPNNSEEEEDDNETEEVVETDND